MDSPNTPHFLAVYTTKSHVVLSGRMLIISLNYCGHWCSIDQPGQRSTYVTNSLHLATQRTRHETARYVFRWHLMACVQLNTIRSYKVIDSIYRRLTVTIQLYSVCLTCCVRKGSFIIVNIFGSIQRVRFFLTPSPPPKKTKNVDCSY